MMGETGSGRNTGGDDEAYRRAVESAPDDPQDATQEGTQRRTSKLAKGKSADQVAPNQPESRGASLSLSTRSLRLKPHHRSGPGGDQLDPPTYAKVKDASIVRSDEQELEKGLNRRIRKSLDDFQINPEPQFNLSRSNVHGSYLLTLEVRRGERVFKREISGTMDGIVEAIGPYLNSLGFRKEK